MIYRAPAIDDAWLTEGVLTRRVFAWLIDALLIGLILAALWFVLLLFGVCVCGYKFLAAQQALGLVVRRDDHLGRPTLVQAFVFTLVFYLTLAATGLLLLFALFTVRKRTLHDLASGLVVVRAQALTRALGSWNMQGGSPYA